MQRPKSTTINYTLLAVASAVAIFFFFKSNSLKKDLLASQEKSQQMALSIAKYQSINDIDAMLFDGRYDQALAAYRTYATNNGHELGSALKARISLTRKLLEKQTSAGKMEDSVGSQQQSDTTTVYQVVTPAEVRLYDSLTLALDKANFQLKNLKRQLKNKSIGEYLTFATSKGKKLHYVGEVKKKKANGKGVALLETGSRYQGEWKNGLRHGEGTFFWPDGQYYVGIYKDDKRHGQGSYYWPNGEKYIGQWANDQRNGEGTFYGKDGEVIASGTWKNDKLNKREK